MAPEEQPVSDGPHEEQQDWTQLLDVTYEADADTMQRILDKLEDVA